MDLNEISIDRNKRMNSMALFYDCRAQQIGGTENIAAPTYLLCPKTRYMVLRMYDLPLDSRGIHWILHGLQHKED